MEEDDDKINTNFTKQKIPEMITKVEENDNNDNIWPELMMSEDPAYYVTDSEDQFYPGK